MFGSLSMNGTSTQTNYVAWFCGVGVVFTHSTRNNSKVIHSSGNAFNEWGRSNFFVGNWETDWNNEIFNIISVFYAVLNSINWVISECTACELNLHLEENICSNSYILNITNWGKYHSTHILKAKFIVVRAILFF